MEFDTGYESVVITAPYVGGGINTQMRETAEC